MIYYMKKKIIFNLSIDDLKELGIIKKRKRRSRKTNKFINTIPSNIKSSSDHMTGFSNMFSNTSNLQTEKLRLENDILTKYPMIKNEAINNNINEDRFKTIENENANNRILAQYMLEKMYRPAIQNYNNDDDSSSEFSNRFESLNSDPNDIVNENDNIDVPSTGGSDIWNSYDNVNDDNNNMPSNIQQVIRSPVQNAIQAIESRINANTTYEKEEEKENIEIQPLTEESLRIHTDNTEQKESQKELTKNQMRYQKQKQNVYNAKQEYISAGGDSTIILQSRNLGEIKSAIILLKDKKNKKKK